MEIERGWWALAQNWNKWGSHSDRLRNMSFRNVKPLGVRLSQRKLLLAKQRLFRQFLPTLVISVDNGLDVYVSISEMLLRTKSNDWKVSIHSLAHPCLPTVIGKLMCSAAKGHGIYWITWEPAREGDCNWSVSHWANKFGKKSRNENEHEPVRTWNWAAISLPQTLQVHVHFLFALFLGWIHTLSIMVTRRRGKGIMLTRIMGAALYLLHFKSGRKCDLSVGVWETCCIDLSHAWFHLEKMKPEKRGWNKCLFQVQ